MNVRTGTRGLRRIGALAASLALLGGVFGGASVAQADSSVWDNFDFDTLEASVSTELAGAHPDQYNEFTFTGDPAYSSGGRPRPWAHPRDIAVKLPAGFTGNVAGFPTCSAALFAIQLEAFNDPSIPPCPVGSQIGLDSPGVYGFFGPGLIPEPLYNLPSPGGDVVARLGFVGVFYPVYIDIKADPQRDYALEAVVTTIPSGASLTGNTTTVWGTPTDPSHDTQRLTALEAIQCFGPCGGPVDSGLPDTAFNSNPTSCGPEEMGFEMTSYPQPDRLITGSAPLPDITDCGAVPFEPSLSLAPTTKSAATSAGIDFKLEVPQDGFGDPDGRASAHLKKAVVTLPEGVSFNPSAADGLGSCSQAQIGVTSVSPLRFDGSDPSCPDSSKVGTGTIVTPALPDPLKAELFVADQDDNPFDSLLAGYMVAEGKGIRIKVGGSFELDPNTGRIKAIFDNNPQQPFSSLELHFKGGNRGVITTPTKCGTYQVDYELTPWSGNPPVDGASSFTVDENCDAANASFNPGFSAGSANTLAGAFTTFVLRVTRNSGTPFLTGIAVDPPLGLTGKLAGIPYCPDSALAAISGDIGSGTVEVATPSCPAESRVGTAIAGAGSGNPFYVDTGKVYLAGPYKGAPLSMAVVAPAVAGPFDLGNVVVRTAIYIDSKTAQLRAVSDPLPTILHGFPLELRDVGVVLDRQGFTLNPTSCEEKSSTGKIAGSGGASAQVSDRFQVGECAALGFKPKISLRLKGGTKRGKNPALTAILRARPGDANLSRLSVALPSAEFLDQSHIGTVCTRVQFAADACPAASVYGQVSATTPLLDYPLSGNVYLRSSDNKLPDLVTDLRGPASQPLRLETAGRTDTVRRGLRNTFDFIPDAPITRVVVRLLGGDKGLLVNSTDICAKDYRATVEFGAQNGRTYTARPKLQPSCSKGHKHAKRHDRGRVR